MQDKKSGKAGSAAFAPEVVQSASDLHDCITKAFTEVAEDILDNPHALDTGEHMLHAHPEAGDQCVDFLVAFGQFAAAWLLRWYDELRSFGQIPLESRVTEQGNTLWKLVSLLIADLLVVLFAFVGATEELDFLVL